jgi:hypothetical protein
MRGTTAAALTFKHPRKQKWIWREPAFRLERGNSESLGMPRVVTTASSAAGGACLAAEQYAMLFGIIETVELQREGFSFSKRRLLEIKARRGRV